MIKIIESLFCSLITTLAITYTSSKLANKKLKFNSYKLFIILVIETIYLSISYYITDNVMRVILNYFVLTLVNKIFLKKNICESNIVAFFTVILFLIAENICAFSMVIILRLEFTQISKWYVSIIINFIIATLVILATLNKSILKFLRNQISKIELSLNESFMLMPTITLVTLLILMYSIYYQFIPVITLLLNIVIIILYLIITVAIFKEKLERKQLQLEHNITLKDLNNFEKRLDKQTKKNHDNNNHLSAIRGMIDPNNKEAIEYIDSLSSDIRKENKTISEKIKDIPYGNLRELIYQKALLMDEKKYNYSLEVSKEIKKLNKINTKMIKDVCTIIGILLDNSIQAVQGYKKKQVGIYFYKENNYLIIKVSNNFKGNLEIEKFDKKGYTSKGKDHGYGLNIVKEILDKNDNIVNEKIFNGDIFSQVIKIKIK